MQLTLTLMRRAHIQTPRADAQDYVTRRAEDNKELGDITQLPYVMVIHHGSRWAVCALDGAPSDTVFNSEVEARAYILRRWW